MGGEPGVAAVHSIETPAGTWSQGFVISRATVAQYLESSTYPAAFVPLASGETREELSQTFRDLRAVDCDILTLGQYLRPTPNHLAVERYVTPDEFDLYRREGLDKGFLEVVAGPMVRSSYRAEQVLQKNNVGLAV